MNLSIPPVMKELLDETKQLILYHCDDSAKSINEIRDELRIPRTSAFRKVHELQKLNLLVVERYFITKYRKKVAMWRTNLKSVNTSFIWNDIISKQFKEKKNENLC